MVLGVTGAVTALGDTLFPAATLAEGIAQDFSPAAHYLVRLRVWHPVIAILVGFYVGLVAGLAAMFHGERRIRRFAAALGGLFILQLLAGLVNLVLLAPVWMQIVHLLLADLVWIALVLLAASLFEEDTQIVQ
jgi:heme A synthase